MLWILAMQFVLSGCKVAGETPVVSTQTGTVTPITTETAVAIETAIPTTTPTVTETVTPTLTPTVTVTLDLGEIYYVAHDGDDGNVGSMEAPFRTFERAISVLVPGDVLNIRGGVYTEMLNVDVSGEKGKPITVMAYSGEDVVIDMGGRDVAGVILSGNYLQFTNLSVRGSNRECISASGNYQWISGLTITDCFSSGIQLLGGNIEFYKNRVYGTVLRNEDGNGRHWNSAVKVLVGGHDLVIRENEVYGNWGEGIAVTRGIRVLVQRNTVYDNWASNIYIDNSYDVLVEKNFSYCTENAPLAKDGYPANAFAIGEEEYEGWGAQLARVTVINNIGAFCKRGIGSWSAEVPKGGLDTIMILHNTFWGSRLHGIGIYVNDRPAKAQDTLIANNIFQQDENERGYIEDATGITIDYNFWVGAVLPKDRLDGVNDLWGDVDMVSEPGYSPESFMLGTGSRAIGYGMRLHFVVDDFFGQERDDTPDLGAIEGEQVFMENE